MLNDPPGAIEPESHAPVFDVDVCGVLSLFVQLTVVPTATLIGFGEYALVVSVDDPLTIETGVPLVGVGDVDGLEELQAAAEKIRAAASISRTFIK
jgi:hypothetical protein